MSTTPPVYPPPVPPRRPSGHPVAIALLIVAMIVVIAIVGIVYSVHIISRNIRVSEQQSAAGNKEVSIKTPVGNIHVNTSRDADAALVGLPLYPGASPAKDHDSPHFSLDMPGITNVDVVAAHYVTPDSIGKVDDYYRDQLKGRITKINAEDSGRRIALELKRDDEEKVVALKGTSEGTSITLVRVLHGAGEVN